MGLDAGSATGQLELDIGDWEQGWNDASNAAKKAESSINGTMVSAGKEAEKLGGTYKDTAKKTDEFAKASVSLDDKLGSLLKTAGSMATLKAGVSAIMGSVSEWAEAEASADRLRVALQFKGMESSLGKLTDLSTKIQGLTGISGDAINQMAAQSIQQGKSVQQTSDLMTAAASYAVATGKDMQTVYDALAKSYGGSTKELGILIPEIGTMTDKQLANGDAVKLINEQYGGFVGKVGNTETSLKVMNEAIGDASEAFGSAMAPVVLVVTDAITGLASIVANAGDVMKNVMAVGATVVMTAFTGLAARTAFLAAAKWGLFGAEMAVNAAQAAGNPLMWAGIAAAVGLVAATTGLVASKIKEANATSSSADALKDHADQAKKSESVLTTYEGSVKKYSLAQLEAAKAELTAARAKSTSTYEIGEITKKLADVESELSKRRKASNDADAADKYAQAMASVRDIIDDNVSEEDKLDAQIKTREKTRTKSAADEKTRLAALSILYDKQTDMRVEEELKVSQQKRDAMEEEMKISKKRTEDYSNSMSVVYSFLDERKQKEKSLLEQITELENFKTQSQDDELLRLQALSTAKTQLTELHKETETKTFWQTAGQAIDDYWKKMDGTKVSLEALGNAFATSTSYLFQQAETVSNQYYKTELANLDAAYKKQKDSLDEQLKAGLISQSDYDTKVAELDEQTKKDKNALAKKQFEDQKNYKIADATMSAANAVAGWWAAAPLLGPIAGPIFAGTETAATAVMLAEQIKLIKKEDFVPTYAKGGTHSGGLAQINEQGGELVNLPDGTTIVPHDLSSQIAADVGSRQTVINVNFAGARIDKDVSLDELADKVSRKIAMRVAR